MLTQGNNLVSVIIPFLNGGQWLAEAIESVIAQEYSQWEIIIIDDGSAEESSMIAKEFCARFPEKIFYKDHPGHINKGVTVSRNVGISFSKGNFIAFLDADDSWLPKKLGEQISLFGKHPDAAMICEASRFWYSWNDPVAKDIVVNVGAQAGLVHHPPELMKTLYPLGNGAPPCPTGIMIKKEAIKRSGGFEESFVGEYQLYEDQAFLSKIYLRENVFISDIPNNLYRKRPGSLTATGEDENHYKKVRLYYLNWLEEYTRKYSINEDGIKQLIHAARLELEPQALRPG